MDITFTEPTKRIFDINEDNIDSIELNNSYEHINNIISVFDEGYSNSISIENNKYEYINRNIDNNSKKISINKNNLVISSEVQTNVLSIVDNLDDFYSYSIKYDSFG